VLAWYPGQQGGNAIADVLFGDANPSGRLPVTFYRSADQLPPFADYGMANRTYRYFAGDPLYPFGHGLSYTRFEYSDLRVDRAELAGGDTVEASVAIKNAGTLAGSEVVQLYARHVAPKLAQPRQQLRGFERVVLAPGETRRVAFRLTPQSAFAHYDEEKRAEAVEPGEYELQAGASSRDIRQTVRVRVR
jgi:beta-glucosidase